MERKEAERKDAGRRAAERREAERKETEKMEVERREAERREAERREAERREAERREAERREAERRETEKRETERKELENKEADRLEMERKEALRQQELRYERLRQVEEAKRLEEMRLEQELRRQFELHQKQQQQQQQQVIKTSITSSTTQKMTFTPADPRANEPLNVRGHLPRLSRTSSFHRVPDQQQQQQQRLDDHLGKVRTGQVNEKRNFWIRSSSMDRLPQQAATSAASPTPRRRRLDSWKSKEIGPSIGAEPCGSRPGSALDHTSNPRNTAVASNFIARSKSSAAVSSHDAQALSSGPAVAALRSLHGGNSSGSAIWSKEKYDQQTTVMQQASSSSHRFQEVRTNQVTETVTAWGSQHSLSALGRTTPTAGRTIAQGFAESRSMMTAQQAGAGGWRTETPEPLLRLVNVTVEPQRSEAGQARCQPVQPPQPPNRNQSYAGKII
jgi:hypothetical protein